MQGRKNNATGAAGDFAGTKIIQSLKKLGFTVVCSGCHEIDSNTDTKVL